MSKKIKIKAGETKISAELNDSMTAEKVWEVLPVQANGSLWGDEIYFKIPVETGYENPKDIVESGDIAFWPSGSAMCIFFGPTPISVPGEIKPARSVNIIGRITGNTEGLKKFSQGEEVRVEREA